MRHSTMMIRKRNFYSLTGRFFCCSPNSTMIRRRSFCSSTVNVPTPDSDAQPTRHNLVMVTAGEAIDLSIGVTFGLSTITAAALGQVVSDSCGTMFGGTVEAAAARLGLPLAGLTQQQERQQKTKFYRTLGGTFGVVVGCFLGMTSLLFMDTERADRLKHKAENEHKMQLVLDSLLQTTGACSARLCTISPTNESGRAAQLTVLLHSGDVSVGRDPLSLVLGQDQLADGRFLISEPMAKDDMVLGTVQLIFDGQTSAAARTTGTAALRTAAISLGQFASEAIKHWKE